MNIKGRDHLPVVRQKLGKMGQNLVKVNRVWGNEDAGREGAKKVASELNAVQRARRFYLHNAVIKSGEINGQATVPL